MNFVELAKRNFKEAIRNPLSLALTLLLPPALLLVLESFGDQDSATFNATFLTPGLALFGFVMLMFSSAMQLSRDRETALLARLLTTPLRARDFVNAYSLPFLGVASIQVAILFALGGALGLHVEGSFILVLLVLLLMAIFYIALGIVFGSLLSVAAVSGAYTAILFLTIFGGAWFDLEEIGGPVETVADVLPFAHSLDAMRAVMVDGAGLADIATDLGWVLAYTLAAAAMAIMSFKRNMSQ